MTTGEELKIKLGLEKNRYVSYVRLIGATYVILLVYYRSRRTNIPLTHYSIRTNWNTLSAKKYPFDNEMMSTPLMPIETLTSTLPSTTLIFCVDLDGEFGEKKNQVKKESVETKKVHPINEWLTFQNLNTPDAISPFTKKYRDERNRLVKPENFTAKLVGCEYDNLRDYVVFTFKTKPTHVDKPTSKVDPDANFEIIPNPENEYEIQIRVLDFMKWLKDTRPEELEGTPITQKDIKDVLEVAYVQVWCSCIAFTYQGLDYWLSQLDGAMYPIDIKPKRWNAEHLHGENQAFLCKHSYGIIRSIDFFLNPMASKLNKTLIDQGYIE